MDRAKGSYVLTSQAVRGVLLLLLLLHNNP
jgi:hypothetical protein